MDHSDAVKTHAARTLALAALAAVTLAGCVASTKPKPEAIDEALTLGGETSAALVNAGLPKPEFIETVDHPCHDEEAVQYRAVARYSIVLEPTETTAALRRIHELWVEDLGYVDIDDGVFWGQSGYAVARAESEEAQFSATRQPDWSTIIVAVSTDCFEDPDEDDWIEPAVPTSGE
ncbi:hypothetical protein L0U85_00330 [Glycomyces sp. L485]|uniref:hypothetical protein n=1 Tax=Glycomyces sp. L485 TaxID=2909235 RepID=UPI001F4B946B|nr:hypothetical protein [Glycomyces sp. L485]MCH7229317.1 hypothetical protein [Glycomyces sp. L485]